MTSFIHAQGHFIQSISPLGLDDIIMYILLQTGRQKKCLYNYQYVMNILTLADKFKQI